VDREGSVRVGHTCDLRFFFRLFQCDFPFPPFSVSFDDVAPPLQKAPCAMNLFSRDIETGFMTWQRRRLMRLPPNLSFESESNEGESGIRGRIDSVKTFFSLLPEDSALTSPNPRPRP